MSASSASGAAAASVADASGSSLEGTICAPAGSTNAMPMPAASISSTARAYPVVEVITPPAFLMTTMRAHRRKIVAGTLLAKVWSCPACRASTS
jgi:hypothetical protein